MPRTSQATTNSRRTSGFSLLELLVVVSIIVLLLGILIPTLGAVRTAARKTQSEAMCTQLVNAMAAFKSDKRRLPGYFNVSEMASTTNWSSLSTASGEPGFTETENVLLELVGGIQPNTTSPDPSLGIYTVGPTDTPPSMNPTQPGGDKIISRDSAKSAAGSGYLKMDSNSLFAIAGQAGHEGGSGEDSPEFARDESSNYVDVVDPFGMPLLVWKRNLAAKRTNTVAPYKLVALNAGSGDENASFYWATNAGYLSASRLGDGLINLRQDAGVRNSSLIGGGDNADAGNVLISLASILANPGFASADGDMSDDLPGASDADDFARPEAFRGDVVVMSAGADRVYFGKRQDPRQSEQGSGDNTSKHVGYLLLDTQTTPTTPIPGSSEVDRFDDIVVSGG